MADHPAESAFVRTRALEASFARTRIHDAFSPEMRERGRALTRDQVSQTEVSSLTIEFA